MKYDSLFYVYGFNVVDRLLCSPKVTVSDMKIEARKGSSSLADNSGTSFNPAKDQRDISRIKFDPEASQEIRYNMVLFKYNNSNRMYPI